MSAGAREAAPARAGPGAGGGGRGQGAVGSTPGCAGCAATAAGAVSACQWLRRRPAGRGRASLVVIAGPKEPSGWWKEAAGRARRLLWGPRGRAEAWPGQGGVNAWAAPAVATALLFAALDAGRFISSLKGDSLARWNELVQQERGRPGLGKASEPTVVYDVRGRVVASFSSETPVALSEVAEPVWRAIVASEDHRFFKHRGVDVRGLLRAAVSLGSRGGGSTITQQLCKNLMFSPERTITRKLVEVFSALVLEGKLSKEDILEEYLNRVYWGHGIYGINQAAATYFRKRPSELDAGEAALLAALLPSPERYSPFRNPRAAAQAQAQVISRMVDTGNLKESEVRMCIGLPPSLAQLPRGGARTVSALKDVKGSGAPYRAPFFVSEVLHQLRDLNVLDQGGLHIHTTLDLALQESAEGILKKDGKKPRLGENRGEASLVACEPASGAVRVLVGGRDYSASTFNRAVNAARCPGSAFKPFVYLAALETGMVTPGTEVQDEAVCFKREGAGWTAETLDHKEKQREAREKELARLRAGVKEKMDAQRKDFEMKLSEQDALRQEKLKELQKLRNRLRSRSGRTQGPDSKGEEQVLEASLMESGRQSPLVNKILSLEDELDELMDYPEFSPDQALLQEDLELQEMAEESSESDSDREEYRPFNYSRKYRGTVTLKTSLSESLNIPTLKLANLIGIGKVVEMSHKLGIQSELPSNLSLALGACEVTPLEMACAYNTIAAGGVYSCPHFVSHVKDRSGKVIYRHKPSRRRACGSAACADLHRMLRAAVMEGTASKALSGWPSSAAAGKTGTSDDYRDAWYGGYTPSLSCVVWVGRDDNSSLPGTGSTLALPLWAQFMRAGHGAGVSAEKGVSRRRVSRWRLKEAW